jgi:uroporphyrinogen decarboxylase
MVEGQGSDTYAQVKRLMYSRPDLMHHILSVTTQAVIDYLNAQIEAGAQAVMVFDSWGGMLTQAAYLEFSLPYMARIMEGLIREREGRTVPRIVFTKGGGLWLEAIAGCGADAVGLDWAVEIGDARRRIGDRVALQGNMDPSILLTTPEAVSAEAERILASYGQGSGHVFNLGHGISQFTPPENVAALVETVKRVSPRYHG